MSLAIIIFAHINSKSIMEETKTNAVSGCTSFDELEAVINEHAPFVSTSRLEEVTWTADKLIERINSVVKQGYPAYYVTRTHGLRNKVIELIEGSF